jgi:hypothetical protein
LKSGVINVSLINRQQIEFQADASAKIAIEIYEDPQNYDRYYNAWMEMFHKTQAVYIYPVVIEYINNGHPLKINIIKNYNKWSLDSEFETVPNLDIKKREQEYYEADVDAKCKAIFDSEVKSLLETARGKKLRENIVLTDSPKVIIAKIKKLLNTANSLEEKGVIIPK